ncbi:nucleotidyltransferase domain-containing protein [Nitrosomonas sp.]|uniref:nucleotidyltransferase family protein n=1 Tax=Nitrosomonas sp. TaxID=42353 RepID=UPI0025CCCD79|nr:nucleotidyltransferase domain-containing protein [Nitrosomonas sp.]
MHSRDINRLQIKPRQLAMLQTLLAQHVSQAQVWAYGSRVSGNAHEGSDLDIVLRNPSNLKAEVPNRLDVQEAIQESDLPMLVDVHDWAHLPEDFHRNIERDYVEIQAGAVDG